MITMSFFLSNNQEHKFTVTSRETVENEDSQNRIIFAKNVLATEANGNIIDGNYNKPTGYVIGPTTGF